MRQQHREANKLWKKILRPQKPAIMHLELGGQQFTLLLAKRFRERLLGWALRPTYVDSADGQFILFLPNTKIVHQLFLRQELALAFIDKQGVLTKQTQLSFMQVSWCRSAFGVFEALPQHRWALDELMSNQTLIKRCLAF